LDLTVELDLIHYIVTLDLPWDTLRVPEVGDFDLFAKFFDDVLFEVAVVVADPVAPGGDLQGGHGVEEAGGETTKAAPAETQVILILIQLLQVITQVLQRLRVLIHQVQVHQDVLHHSPLQILRGQVVHTFRVMISVVLVGVIKALNQAVSYAAGHCHGQVALIEVEPGFHHRVLYVIHDLLLYKPAFMPEVGAHQAPQFGVHVLLRALLLLRRQHFLMYLIHFLV